MMNRGANRAPIFLDEDTCAPNAPSQLVRAQTAPPPDAVGTALPQPSTPFGTRTGRVVAVIDGPRDVLEVTVSITQNGTNVIEPITVYLDDDGSGMLVTPRLDLSYLYPVTVTVLGEPVYRGESMVRVVPGDMRVGVLVEPQG